MNSLLAAILISLAAGPADHPLSFDHPITSWDEALPLGNGTLGALVWGDGHPLNISLDRTDLWDLRPVAEFSSPEYSYKQMQQWETDKRYDDLVRLYEAPYNRPGPTKIPAGRIELRLPDSATFASTSLDIAHARATTSFSDGITARAFIDSVQPVGVIRVDGTSAVTARINFPHYGGAPQGDGKPSIVAGSLDQLGYPPAEETSGANFHAFVQHGWEDFRFAVYLAWKPNATGKSWTAAWSVATSTEGADPLAIARERVQSALARGVDALFAEHTAWWDAYWAKSSISVPDPLIERQWYLDTYKFGAASRAGAPPITLQGPWTADDGKLPPWKGDYHHDLNTELTYWPCYTGNHLDEGRSYVDWLWETRGECEAWTQRFFGLPGMNVPMTADLRNRQIGGWRQYTHSATTGAWLAHHFYLHWRYTMDRDFLHDRAYLYLRSVAVFLEAVSQGRDAQGFRSLPLSSSPEINDNTPKAWFHEITNYDLALMRWLFGATAELAGELGNSDDQAHWQKVLAECPPLATSDTGELLIAKNTPLTFSHRHFSHLMAIYPLGLIDTSQGADSTRIIAASLADLDRLGTQAWCGYSFAWHASLAARAGDGDRAANALRIFAGAFTLPNSFHANGDQSGKGYSSFTYRPFTLEGNFASAAGLQEMLLQSHTGVIHVFPAVPADWKDVSFTNLRAQGAFLVSARRANGAITELHVTAERGGTCKIALPNDSSVRELTFAPHQTIDVLTAAP